VELGLALLNLRHTERHGTAIPAGVPSAIDADTAARSRAYTLAKERFGIAAELYGAALTLLLLLSGVVPALDAALARAGLAGAHRFVAFLVALSIVTAVAHLPVRLYGTFVLEERFGFNRTTPALWLKNRAKGIALSAAIGLPLLYATYGFMAFAGETAPLASGTGRPSTRS
jgi:STE24 endopeptidase